MTLPFVSPSFDSKYEVVVSVATLQTDSIDDLWVSVWISSTVYFAVASAQSTWVISFPSREAH